jgi:hypothetical protein
MKPFNPDSNSCLALQNGNVMTEDIFELICSEVDRKQAVLVPVDFAALGSIIRKFQESLKEL